MGSKLCIRVCENFLAEVTATVRSLNLNDVKITHFPAYCGNPLLKREDLCAIGCESCKNCHRTHVLSGRCIAGQDPSPAEEADRCRLHRLDQCFYLIAPKTMIDRYLADGAYLLTPGWLSGWRRKMEKWGFDVDTARQFFGESCTRLVLLDTGVVPESPAHLSEFADFVSRPFEIVLVGQDFLGLFIEKIVLQWRLEGEQACLLEVNRQSADYAMAYELIARLTGIKSEEEAIEDIFDLFNMLFAPEKLAYVPIHGSNFGKTCCRPKDSPESWPTLECFHDDCLLPEPENGFVFRIGNEGEVLGLIQVCGIAFPQYMDRYLNMAVAMGRVCGLAIRNARAYREILRAGDELRQEIQERKKAEDERRRMEKELLRLQKFDAMSVFVGGIAHDFNNLLGVILGHVSMAQLDADPRKPIFQELEAAYTGTVRAGDLVKKLIAVSESQVPVRQEASIRKLMAKAAHSVLSGFNVELELSAPDSLWHVEVDPMQVSGAIRNVVENAGEAAGPCGLVRICAENVSIPSDGDKIGFPMMKTGRYVRISIIDRGAGISEENLSRIFDPYFSTKARGARKGMGMGLTIACSVIKKHDGYIQVESKPGAGTTIHVYLPALPQKTLRGGETM